MTLSNEAALRLAREWIDAWNAGDLDRIMRQYSDDVEMVSPLMHRILPGSPGRLRGRDALRHYFAEGKRQLPEARFELTRVFLGVDSLTVLFRGATGVPVSEALFVDDAGLICRLVAHYPAEGDPP